LSAVEAATMGQWNSRYGSTARTRPWISMKAVAFRAGILAVLVLCSCGTMISRSLMPRYCGKEPLPNVYSGVVLDVQGALHYECAESGECRFFTPGPTNNVELFLLLDIPLSLALDTCLLPWTAYQQIRHGNICNKLQPITPDASRR
jgi:uncharacterized protein YceK